MHLYKNSLLRLFFLIIVYGSIQGNIYSPENTIILWDMHDVFMKPTQNRIIKTIWNYENKWDIISNFDYNTIKTFFRFVIEKIGFADPITTAEHIFHAAKKAGNPNLVDLIITISCEYTPTETVRIIEALHTLGYQQDLGSNVAHSTFLSFKTIYPDIFNFFTNFHTITIDTPKKPSIDYFSTYNTRYNSNLKQVIFIDDKEKNIAAAEKIGIIGILFKDTEQLYKDLRSLGITLPELIFEKKKKSLHNRKRTI